MSTDPKIRIRELVRRCRAAGSSRLYIDQPFFAAVCRAYAVDPGRKGLHLLSLDGFEIGRLDVLPPDKKAREGGTDPWQPSDPLMRAFSDAVRYGRGTTRTGFG